MPSKISLEEGRKCTTLKVFMYLYYFVLFKILFYTLKYSLMNTVNLNNNWFKWVPFEKHRKQINKQMKINDRRKWPLYRWMHTQIQNKFLFFFFESVNMSEHLSRSLISMLCNFFRCIFVNVFSRLRARAPFAY